MGLFKEANWQKTKKKTTKKTPPPNVKDAQMFCSEKKIKIK